MALKIVIAYLTPITHPESYRELITFFTSNNVPCELRSESRNTPLPRSATGILTLLMFFPTAYEAMCLPVISFNSSKKASPVLSSNTLNTVFDGLGNTVIAGVSASRSASPEIVAELHSTC
jgi:hypothetical protein